MNVHYVLSLYQMGFQYTILHSTFKILSKSDMSRVLPLYSKSRLELYYNLQELGLFTYDFKNPRAWVMC